MEKENCKQCIEEFDRLDATHTYKSHIEDYLSDTIEAYERESYRHGKSAFRDTLETDILRYEAILKGL